MLFRFTTVLLFLLIATNVFSQNIEDKIYREEELYVLLERIDEDKVLQLEWFTSMYFHKIINDYRNKHKRKSIHWDHKLWLAARNHNIYLLKNDVLTHNQSKNKSFYTGQFPVKRIDYVCYNSKEFGQSISENCYTPGYTVIDISSASMEEMKSFAEAVAADAFDAWKHSPGHNENMLRPENLSHGTSISFGSSKYAGTSVFTMNLKSYSPDTILLSYFDDIVNRENFSIKNDYHDFSLPKDKLQRTNYKSFYMTMEFFKNEKIEPNQALYKMTELKSIPKDQKELNKTYRKQKGLKGIFELFGNEVKYHEESITLSYEDFIKLKAADPLRSKLKAITAEYNGKEIKSWGGDVNSERIGEEVEISVRILLLVEK